MIRQVKRPDILDGKGKGIFQLLSYSGIWQPKPSKTFAEQRNRKIFAMQPRVQLISMNVCCVNVSTMIVYWTVFAYQFFANN